MTKNLYISQAGFIVGIFADGSEWATDFPLNYLSECKTKIIMKLPLSTAMLKAAMEAKKAEKARKDEEKEAEKTMKQNERESLKAELANVKGTRKLELEEAKQNKLQIREAANLAKGLAKIAADRQKAEDRSYE